MFVEGDHGWNNTWMKMHATFIASGPAFKRGATHRSFENVNVYPLMCKVLEIACPSTNGSLSVVQDMLAVEVKESNAISTIQTGKFVA